MKLLPENIKVLYFASDCVEPYVEVGLLCCIMLGDVLHPWSKIYFTVGEKNVLSSSIHSCM